MTSHSSSPPHLFQPLTIKSITLRNRIGVSPMCEYSSEDGMATDWHLVHLGSRAVGGAGLVMAEATAVSPEGRITPGDAGIWADKHLEPIARINRFIKQHGAVPGIQIAHAGRKASAALPWEGGASLADDAGGWSTIAPSAIAFGGELPKVPRAMSEADIARVQSEFVAAAKRSLAAGAECLELHSAHGYLSEFQPTSGSLWRQFRESHPFSSGDDARRPRGLAGAVAVAGADFLHGLGAGRLGHRGEHRAGATAEGRGRGPD
jgi:2,4-dienoyl-CoA reductase-like NADH-dependent reductase (Old Yellow Enzyme family)